MEEDSKRVRTSGRARGTVVAAEQRLHNEKLVCVLVSYCWTASVHG